jgi:hypothetical protein
MLHWSRAGRAHLIATFLIAAVIAQFAPRTGNEALEVLSP